MKKNTIYIVSLMLVLLVVFSSFTTAAIYRRNSTRVSDVFDAYTALEWIVSPAEEQYGDQQVSNAPECDIKSIISCYDSDYLRVDIMLYNPVTYDLQVGYGVILQYEHVDEYYIFYPYSDEFIYCKAVGSEILDYRSLKDNQYDFAGVTEQNGIGGSDIFIIINKDIHLNGLDRERYYLTCSFYSGFIDLDGNFQIADQTVDVELEFEM